MVALAVPEIVSNCRWDYADGRDASTPPALRFATCPLDAVAAAVRCIQTRVGNGK